MITNKQRSMYESVIEKLKEYENLWAKYTLGKLMTPRYRTLRNLADQHKVWTILGKIDPPYQDSKLFNDYIDSLKLLKLDLNVPSIQDKHLGGTLNISQLLIVFHSTKEWTHISSHNKRNLILELCRTIKTDINDLNKICGIQLLVQHINILTDNEQQLIQRTFRFKNANIYQDPDILMEQIFNKYLPHIADVWKIAQLFKTSNISEVTILEWAELFQAKKLVIKTVQLPENLIDFEF